MTAATMKRVVKEAINEALNERLESAVAEAIEDIALVKAIDKGRKSKPVSRAQVMRSLQGKK